MSKVGQALHLGAERPGEQALRRRLAVLVGRYLFSIKASGPGQGLRPLRDPDAVENGEDED
ncbi:hypothetical protein AB0C61_17855 [Streptomyces sp. NPDC048680]|uniref:hypothetical protein n=1 Tax=Streptomyces sp. NPDC048680 TaxID=3155492 RepID=UPI003434F189